MFLVHMEMFPTGEMSVEQHLVGKQHRGNERHVELESVSMIKDRRASAS